VTWEAQPDSAQEKTNTNYHLHLTYFTLLGCFCIFSTGPSLRRKCTTLNLKLHTNQHINTVGSFRLPIWAQHQDFQSQFMTMHIQGSKQTLYKQSDNWRESPTNLFANVKTQLWPVFMFTFIDKTQKCFSDKANHFNSSFDPLQLLFSETTWPPFWFRIR